MAVEVVTPDGLLLREDVDSVVTPGEAQLAAVVGVDPAQYTLIELAAMQPQP